jgi:hypothetical protein
MTGSLARGAGSDAGFLQVSASSSRMITRAKEWLGLGIIISADVSFLHYFHKAS